MFWYQRDASWHRNPNTRSPKKYHLLGEDERALCSRNIILITETPCDPENGKCKRCLKIYSIKE